MARPRKEDAIDIRGRAVTEAIALMRESPDNLSLSALSKRIGCSAPALYAHFANKDDLLERVRERVFDEMLTGRTDRAEGEEAHDKVRDEARSFIEFARENPALYRLVFAPQHSAEETRIQIDTAAVAPMAAAVRATGMNRNGHANGQPAETLAHTIWCTVHGAIMMALDGQYEGSDAARWSRVHEALDTVVDLLAGQR